MTGIYISAAIDTPVDSGTAYLGKWRLAKLDSVAFVARPLRSKNHGNKPAAVSPVAAFAMIQFKADGRLTGTAGYNQLFGHQNGMPNFSRKAVF